MGNVTKLRSILHGLTAAGHPRPTVARELRSERAAAAWQRVRPIQQAQRVARALRRQRELTLEPPSP